MAYYRITQQDINDGNFNILPASEQDQIIRVAYFHPVDIDIVRDQIDVHDHTPNKVRPPVFGFQILPAIIRKEAGQNPVQVNILVAVNDIDNAGNIRDTLTDPGDIVALSCPPFTDTHGGKKHIVPN